MVQLTSENKLIGTFKKIVLGLLINYDLTS